MSRALNAPVVVESVMVEPPGPGEVTLRMAAVGVCHSDLSATNGTIALPLPLVLGHEGAGTVVAVGDGVQEVAEGDVVVTSFVSMCGRCRFCTLGRPALCDVGARALATLPSGRRPMRDAAGEPLSVFAGCGVMAEYATLSVNSVVRITRDVPLDRAALVGCAVLTGFGAVANTAQVPPGASVAVLGAGGVGLNAIQAAALAGAASIIAVDTNPAKLELARAFGATAVLDGRSEGLPKAIRKLSNGGVDYAFECVGSGELAAVAYGSLAKGGTAVIVGVAPGNATTSFRTASMTFEEKTLTGSYFGSSRPRVDVPRILGLHLAGKLKLEELITRRYPIDDAPQAFDDLVAGRNARGVLMLGD